MEKKKNDKKRRRNLKLFIFFQILLLLLGLLVTDYVIRDMTGFEEGKLIGYDHREEYYVIKLFGEELWILKEEVQQIAENVYQRIELVQSFMDEGIQYIRQRINR